MLWEGDRLWLACEMDGFGWSCGGGVKKKTAKVVSKGAEKKQKNCEFLFLVYPERVYPAHNAIFRTKLGPSEGKYPRF